MLGRELTELDFTLQGVPRSMLDRCPDVHPLLGRLLSKTFVRDVIRRFPTEETASADPTGFQELIQLLGACQPIWIAFAWKSRPGRRPALPEAGTRMRLRFCTARKPGWKMVMNSRFSCWPTAWAAWKAAR